MGQRNWCELDAVLAPIEARREGMKVTADVLLNGEAVLWNGEPTGARAGRASVVLDIDLPLEPLLHPQRRGAGRSDLRALGDAEDSRATRPASTEPKP